MIDGPGGPGKPKDPGTDISRTGGGHEAVASTGSASIEGIDILANKFTSICSENLEQNISPETIRINLIKEGFPAALAETLGQSLLDRIADARESLSVATKKPALREALIASTRSDIIEYFQINTEVVERSMLVSQDPVGYLEASINALTTGDLENLSIDQLNSAMDAFYKFNSEGLLRLRSIFAKKACELIKEKFGYEAKEASIIPGVTPGPAITIDVSDGAGTGFSVENYLREKLGEYITIESSIMNPRNAGGVTLNLGISMKLFNLRGEFKRGEGRNEAYINSIPFYKR